MGDHDAIDESRGETSEVAVPPAARPPRDAAPPPADLSEDAALVRLLREDGFSGPRQDAVDIMLVRYALPILRKWQRDGSIVERCSREGRGFPADLYERATLREDVAERIALADETVARALQTFKRCGLAGGGWDPARGRSLRSYFVTACVREYAAVFRRWSTERKRQPPTAEYGLDPFESLHPPSSSGRAGPTDPADVVINRLVPDPELLTVPPDILRIAQGLADGLTYDEIGATTGLTARAVEGRIRRFRLKHRRPT